MITIPQRDQIAKEATERIRKEFAEFGFSNPPVVTSGIVSAVLDSLLTLHAPDVGWVCGECEFTNLEIDTVCQLCTVSRPRG